MIYYDHKVKVYYRDVDQMGVVYHTRYLEYFEESRTELLSSIGLEISNVEQEGVMFPVISCHCDFKKGAKFEDVILVKSFIDEMPRSTLKISYRAVLKKTNILLVKGYTSHAFLDSMGKPIKPPKSILSCMHKYFED